MNGPRRNMPMKILVTGACGQLGYDVCKVLVELKIEHRGVDIAQRSGPILWLTSQTV